jgi:hypothetical protein
MPVESGPPTEECLVYELTRRPLRAQRALAELRQRRQERPGDSTVPTAAIREGRRGNQGSIRARHSGPDLA